MSDSVSRWFIPPRNLAALTDVEITNPTNAQHLEYEAATDTWINKTPSAGGGDTKVELFENAIQIGVVARRLNMVDVDDFILAENIPNDWFDVTINRNAANGIAGLDATSRILAAQAALNTEFTTNKDAVNGYAGLDGTTKVILAQIPDLPTLGTLPASPRQTAITNAELLNLPLLGTLPASPRQINITNAELNNLPILGTLPASPRQINITNAELNNLPLLGTLPASPRPLAIVNAEISTVDALKVTTGRFPLARLPTGTLKFYLRGTGAGDPAYERRELTKGGTILDPDVRNIIVWRAPFPCTVTNVRAYRVGGTGATINARKNGSLDHLAADHSITVADTWQDGGAVQNTAYVAGDKLEIKIITLAGTPTQIAILVEFTEP